MIEVVTIRPDGTKNVEMHCDGPSMTRQEFRDECDLAKTLARFRRTPDGELAFKQARGFVDGRFEDVSSVPDLQTARSIIERGKEVFMALPAVLRRRFNNDPSVYLDFVHDPKNIDELRSLGLANPVKLETTPPKVG